MVDFYLNALPFLELKNSRPNLYPRFSLDLLVSLIILFAFLISALGTLSHQNLETQGELWRIISLINKLKPEKCVAGKDKPEEIS